MFINFKLIRSVSAFLLICAFLATTGAICSKKSTTTPTLTVWHLFDDPDSMTEIIQGFEQTNNVKVNLVTKDLANYENESLQSITTGQGPDVWMIRNDWIYKNKDRLTPLPENLIKKSKGEKRTYVQLLQDNVVPAVTQDVVIDNQVYALPLSMDTLAIYFNRTRGTEILNQLSDEQKNAISKQPITTWDELISVANALTTKTGNNISVSGLAMGAANVRYSEDILSAIMLQNNTKILSEDLQTATFNLPDKTASGEIIYPGKNSLDFYTSFTNPSSDHYTWNSGLPDSVDAFVQNKVAMIFGYQFTQEEIKQKAPGLDFQIIALPQVKGATKAIDYPSYWTQAVPKFAPNQDLAWQFITYFDRNVGKYLKKTGHASYDKNSDLASKTIPERDSYQYVFDLQTQTAKSWSKGPIPDQLKDIFNGMISAVNSGISPTNAIDKAATDTTSLLRQQ